VIKRIKLIDFRNYADDEKEFNKGLNVIIGDNGRGKTNLLEAVYFLLQGRSMRTSDVKEMIRKGREEALVKGVLDVEGEKEEAAALNREEGVIRHRTVDYIDAVFFQPDDIWMIKKGPEGRRAALDEIIKTVKRGYGATLREYQRVLRQRNEAIKLVRKGARGREYMRTWNPLLYRRGREIVEEREKMIGVMEGEMRELAERWGIKEVSIRYYCSMERENEEKTAKRIRRLEEAEIRRGMTLIGPHRDEILIAAGGRNARRECSQGEQKILVITWKLAQAKVVSEKRGNPILLLMDDCLSELDERNRKRTMKELEGWEQVLVTVTEDSEEFDGCWKVILN